MKRYGQLWEKFISEENFDLAERNAGKGKGSRDEVRTFRADRDKNLKDIRKRLEDGTYRTSERFWFWINDPKRRRIGKLPYSDLVVHHALLNVLEPIWKRQLTRDTYSCLKGRGIHACSKAVEHALRIDPRGTKYCLKLDISKFYPNVNHDILKYKIRRKVKDERILAVLFEIIDSSEGLTIGDHISSILSHLYHTDLDHKIKEVLHVRWYFRYADDMVLLAATKEELWAALAYIERELKAIGLHVKPNAQVFPVESRGIDFIGYVFRHTHTKLRKSIKKRMLKKVKQLKKRNATPEEAKTALAGHWGWAKHCNTKHLFKSIKYQLGYEIKFKHQTRLAA